MNFLNINWQQTAESEVGRSVHPGSDAELGAITKTKEAMGLLRDTIAERKSSLRDCSDRNSAATASLDCSGSQDRGTHSTCCFLCRESKAGVLQLHFYEDIFLGTEGS